MAVPKYWNGSTWVPLLAGPKGDTGATGATGATGPQGPAGPSDHGALSGLGDDDHPLYARVDGTRAFTGSTTFQELVELQRNDTYLIFKDTSSPTDQNKFAIVNDGSLIFRSVLDNLGMVAQPIRLTHAGEVQMTGASAVTVPAATAATHAAQVSAYDPTTGRIAIGGVELGDTGWRQVCRWRDDGTGQVEYDPALPAVLASPFVPNYLPPSFSAGASIRIRRIGHMIFFMAARLGTTTTLTRGTHAITDIAFDGFYGTTVTQDRPWPTVSQQMVFSASGKPSIAAENNQSVSIDGNTSISPPMPCFSAWPTTLPGIPG